MKRAVRVFKALADPTRLRIMLLLSRRELCVCELMFILGLEQSRISHHMRVLRDAGIAEDVRDGRWIIYRIPEEARPLLEGLLAGDLETHLGLSNEASKDRSRLELCIREDVRHRLCKAQPPMEDQ
jgi:ArsR family transcriptional regulator, arsenate/arsenite/antimonite-responsive transcriptional repressor